MKPTVPLPVPLAPALMVIHGTLLVAVHGQLPEDATLTIPLLPEAEKFCEVGLRLKVWTASVTAFEVSLPQELETTKS